MQTLECGMPSCRGRAVLRLTFAGILLAGQAGFVSSVEAQSITHMGQPLANHVTLQGSKGEDRVCDDGFSTFRRVLLNGDVEQPFTIPRTHVLVVTDVEWHAKWVGVPPNKPIQGPVSINLNISVDQNLVFKSRTVTSISGEYFGNQGSSEQLTSGFVVHSDGVICATAFELHGRIGVAAKESEPVDLTQLVLRGYLIENPS